MSSAGTLHVVGAGLAGLAAAVAAAKAGQRVVVHEAAGHAGGRCRSFMDERLGRVIDNGSHLVLGANRTALAYARATGGIEAMEAAQPAFPFIDLASAKSWTVTPSRPPAGIGEILRALGLPWTGKSETVGSRLGHTASFTRFWLPMCEAIMNTAPHEASARMFTWTMRKALLGGAPALTPWIFPGGLSAALVAPALATLSLFGAEIHFRRRLKAVNSQALSFDDTEVALGAADRVILALPPWVLAPLLPGTIPDMPTRPIVNAHFRCAQPIDLPHGSHFLGLVNASGHWLFTRGDVLSVTVSAAGSLVDLDNDSIAERLWEEIRRALNLPPIPPPPYRIMKEKRATLAHDNQTTASRPGPVTGIEGIFLAGDWIASPWPCTIEAAISSGLSAARLALSRPGLTF
ncbi:Squalene-associated FAD-dependent desaturase HpnE [Paramagnetospirillum magnetotacticum MS-1]|uniref:Squalene-associated FAD-dependent desaturase HpnE n=1 Tax=Paramagnetospirillum magnetotacticum MS-1 TaxID=272627 RepID=A0A0C2YUX3_PARME|nr:FAD-dependent oxidoreductase [Paramagnetospirillum magnetotacticum]KIL98923.1 Squalene-associated FAD-dependent desaturase HpnE [Paramagnetospirillum magnetotacticum MS-1]